MASEGQRDEGAKPGSLGRVARSWLALTALPRGSSGRLAPAACRERFSLREGTHIPISAPSCLCHTAVCPGTSRDPNLGSTACRSLGESCCWVGAVELTPTGRQLSQET